MEHPLAYKKKYTQSEGWLQPTVFRWQTPGIKTPYDKF